MQRCISLIPFHPKFRSHHHFQGIPWCAWLTRHRGPKTVILNKIAGRRLVEVAGPSLQRVNYILNHLGIESNITRWMAEKLTHVNMQDVCQC